MAALFQPVRTPVFANAAIAPGAVINFFEAGTSTPKTVYSDAGLTTALGTSVTADANGSLAAIYLDTAAGFYKYRIEDADGVLIDEEDNYSGVGAFGAVPQKIDSIAEDIAGLAAVEGQQISATGWHAGSEVGGGDFVGRASIAKSQHNGGTIISPTVPAVSAQAGATLAERVANFIAGAGETDAAGSGVFVRSRGDAVLIEWFGAQNATDAKRAIQAAQDVSESTKTPLDFSSLSDIRFTGRIVLNSWLEWRGAGRHITTIKPSDTTRTAVGGDAYIAKADTTVSVAHFLIEDIGFDGGYTAGGTPATENLISMARLTAGSGANDKDITALRCHFKDTSHEAFVAGVTPGSTGTTDGVRMLFCSGDVSSLAGASRNTNMFKAMVGDVDSPGTYGSYPIKNVVSFGNTCRGFRTLNDFKRGVEHWTISACETEDMTDCHHSTDGSRYGTFEASNKGQQTADATVATKNFLEIQGEHIDVMGGDYDCGASPTTGNAGILVTDYAYPSETAAVSTRANQSKHVNVYGFTAKGVQQNCVRMVSTADSLVENVKATDCSLDAVSWEFTTGKTAADGSAIVPARNQCRHIKALGTTRSAVQVVSGNDVQLFDVTDSSGRCSISNVNFDSAATLPIKSVRDGENLNPNPMLTDFAGGTAPNYWTTGTGPAAYAAETADVPRYAPVAFTLTDGGAALEFRSFNQKIAMTQNDVLFFSLWIKQSTATAASILVQQYDDAGTFLSSTFVDLNVSAATSWSRRLRKFSADQAACAYVQVSLAPANNSSAPSATGATKFANVRISRDLII